MPSEKAIRVRDQLSEIIDELMLEKDDQEANILACCVALSIEEVEKWAYNGEFTPSVAPIIQGKVLGVPFRPGEEDDTKFMGPPWARIKKSSLSGMDVLNRLKSRSASKPVTVPKISILDKYQPGDWTVDVRMAFFNGNRGVFISEIRKMVEPGYVSSSDASDYLFRMQKSHPAMWASRKGIQSV